VSLDQITPATASLDASPADFLMVAFPRHGRMVDPGAGVWINDTWVPDDVIEALSALSIDPDTAEAEQVDEMLVVAEIVEHHHVADTSGVHPEDLPACLPSREQMLDDVMAYPVAEVVAAIDATRSAEPGVLLNAMAVPS
jgi:hypothetical protein